MPDVLRSTRWSTTNRRAGQGISFSRERTNEEAVEIAINDRLSFVATDNHLALETRSYQGNVFVEQRIRPTVPSSLCSHSSLYIYRLYFSLFLFSKNTEEVDENLISLAAYISKCEAEGEEERKKRLGLHWASPVIRLKQEVFRSNYLSREQWNYTEREREKSSRLFCVVVVSFVFLYSSKRMAQTYTQRE